MLRIITLEESAAPGRGFGRLCAADPSLTVLARCESIEELQGALQREHPDLLVLDTEVCRLAATTVRRDFAGLLRALRLEALPLTIVITPSMRFASAAFEIGAVDYLVKPVEEQRFHRAIARARERMSAIQALRFYREYAEGKRAPARLQQVTIKCDRRVRFLATEDIQSIVSCRNNVIVHTAGESHVFRSTLGGIEGQLADQSFLRIERSIVLNLRYVREVQRLPRRRFSFRLQNGQCHVSGAFYCRRILEYLQECQPFLDLARTRSSGRSSKLGGRRTRTLPSAQTAVTTLSAVRSIAPSRRTNSSRTG